MPTLPAAGVTAVSTIADDGRELALLRAVLDAVDEAVLVTTPELDPPGPFIEYVNPAVTRMTGYPPEELLGNTPRMFHGPNTDRAVLDRLRSDLADSCRFQGSAVNYRKDGSEYVVEWVILPLHGEVNQVLHWVAVQRDITEQRHLETRQEHLLGELNHRVKNTLSTVQSLATLTARSTTSPQIFAESFQARLLALSQAHNLLTESEWAGASLRELLTRELAPFCGSQFEQCSFEGEDVQLPPRVALALSMAFHELAINAAAYGALLVPEGRLRVTWTLSTTPAGRLLSIHWLERHGPAVVERQRTGFGSRYLERGLARELQGTVRLQFEPDGISCSIDVLLPAAG